MKENYRVDYRQQTAAYYTTYVMPSEIRQSLEANKYVTSRIASQNSAAITSEARQYMADPMRGRIVDRLV